MKSKAMHSSFLMFAAGTLLVGAVDGICQTPGTKPASRQHAAQIVDAAENGVSVVEMMRLLEGSPFTADGVGFRAFAEQRKNATTLLAAWAARVSESDFNRQSVREKLEAARPRTLGLDVCAAMLSAWESPRRLALVLRDSAAQFPSLSAEQKAEIMLLLHEADNGTSYDRMVADPVIGRLLAKVIEERHAAADQLADALLVKKLSLEQINAAPDTGARRNRNPLIADVYRRDKARGAAMLRRVADIFAGSFAPGTADLAFKKSMARRIFCHEMLLAPDLVPLVAAELRAMPPVPASLPDLSAKMLIGTGPVSAGRNGFLVDPAIAVELFETAGWLGPAASFDPFVEFQIGIRDSLLRIVCVQLVNLEGLQDSRLAVLARARKVSPPTFGSILTDALLGEERIATLVRDMPAAWRTEYEARPRTTQSTIAGALADERQITRAIGNHLNLYFARTTIRPSLELEARLQSATDIAEVKLPKGKEWESLHELLAELAATGERPSAAQAFEKAANLHEKERQAASKGAAGINGWTWRTRLMGQVLGSARAKNMNTLAFAMDRCVKDASGRLQHDGTSDWGGFDDVLYFRWLELGGRAAPALAVRKLVDALSRLMPDVPPAVLAPSLFGFARFHSITDREQILAWARAPGVAGKSAELARELAVACGLVIEATATDREPGEEMPGAYTRTPAQEPLWAHYRKSLDDPSLPPLMRVALGHFLCDFDLVVPDDIVLAHAKRVASLLSRGGALTRDQLEFALQAVCDMPDSIPTQDALDALWNAHEQYSQGKVWRYDSTLGFTMLRLAAKSGDAHRILQTMRLNERTFATNALPVAILAGEGRHQIAARHLKSVWRTLVVFDEDEVSWNDRLAAAVEPLRVECGDPVLATLAELSIAALPDPDAWKAAHSNGFAPRAARLARVAEQLGATPGGDPLMRQMAAEVIAEYNPRAAVTHLATEIDACSASSSPAKLASLKSLWERAQRAGPLAAKMAVAAAKGNLQPARQTLAEFQSLLASAKDDQKQVNFALISVIDQFADCALALWVSGEARQASLWLPFLEDILASEWNEQRAGGIAASMGLALRAIEGVSAPWDSEGRWKQERVKEALKAYNTTWLCLAALAGKDAARLPADKRVAMIEACFHNPILVAHWGAEQRMVYLLHANREILSRTELLAAAPRLAEAHPLARVATDFATSAAEQGQGPLAHQLLQIARGKTMCITDDPKAGRSLEKCSELELIWQRASGILQEAALYLREGNSAVALKGLQAIDVENLLHSYEKAEHRALLQLAIAPARD